MRLSVIIATCERPASLARLVESLTPQLGDDTELLIAENGSARQTAIPEVAGARVIHFYERAPGKCRVQNHAIEQARGEILAFLDDDVTACADYIAQVGHFFARYPEFAAMKGRVRAQEDPVKVAGRNAVYLDLPLVDHGDKVIEVPGVLGVNMAFRAAALQRVGPFDERLGPGAGGHEEETEMSARLRRAGYRIGYAPGAIVFHEVDPARADPARYIRIAHERGRCRVMHEHHSLGRVRIDRIVTVLRLGIARLSWAAPERLAREQKRLATADGMLEGLREQRAGVFGTAPQSS
ncbi:MAG TPA: glycosyltransferase [Candidatus Binataceae bacterium]|nr:glycosyltransferase [Candidatus Binataceae bacterium]